MYRQPALAGCNLLWLLRTVPPSMATLIMRHLAQPLHLHVCVLPHTLRGWHHRSPCLCPAVACRDPLTNLIAFGTANLPYQPYVTCTSSGSGASWSSVPTGSVSMPGLVPLSHETLICVCVCLNGNVSVCGNVTGSVSCATKAKDQTICPRQHPVPPSFHVGTRHCRVARKVMHTYMYT